MSDITERGHGFSHPTVNLAESDRVYGTWDISYSEHTLNVDDTRSFLFFAIVRDDYDMVLEAVSKGADPNSVFMPIGTFIELPDFDTAFVNSKSCDWVHKYGMTAVGLCVASSRPSALRGLIDSGAVVEDAYFISVKMSVTDSKHGVAPALDPNVLIELQKVKQGWSYLGQANGVLYTGAIRSEIVNQSWTPMFRGNNANKTADGNSPVLVSDKSSETEVHNKRLQVSNASSSANANTSGCFVATACYGDADAPEVRILREYRDKRLLNSYAGCLFVRMYYLCAPSIATYLRKHKLLASFVTRSVLNPIVSQIRNRLPR